MPQPVIAPHRLRLGVAVAVGAGVLPLGLGGAAAAGTPVRLAGSVDAAIHGEALVLSGRVPARTQRPVELQRRTPEQWVRVGRARTDRVGAYAFERTVRARTSTYRVVALRTPTAERSATPRMEVVTLPQSVDLDVPEAVERDAPAVVEAAFTPARTGRLARLERAVGDGWERVTSQPQSSAGEVTFTLPTSQQGVETYRVVGRSWEGARRVNSAARTMSVTDPRDTTPPSVPTDLLAVPGDGTAGLSWAAVGDDDLAGYRVWSAASETGPWTEVTDAPVQQTDLDVDGLTNDVPVLLAVSSLDTSGNESARSTPVSVTPVDDVAPAVPQDLAASVTPGVRSAELTWSPVADGGLAGYRVYTAASATGPWTELTDEPTTGTSWTAGDLEYGHAVLFSVTAEDLSGNESARSTSSTAVPARTMRMIGDAPADTALGDYAMSDDGRLVVYYSTSPDLVPGDTNKVGDVFLWDRTTDAVERISVAADGTEGNQVSQYPTISGDGQWVAFVSHATNLATDGPTGRGVFVRNVATGTTEMVTRTAAGLAASGFHYGPSLDDSGRYLAFRSSSTQLTPSDTDAKYDVFRWDRLTGTTTRVSTAADGTAPSIGVPHASPTQISGDGQHVVWTTAAPEIVPGDANGTFDVFSWDARSGTNTLVSATPQGGSGNAASSGPTVSDDGSRIVFSTDARDLVPGTPAGGRTVVLWEQGSGLSLVSGGLFPFISGDGRRVATTSFPEGSRSFVVVHTIATGVREMARAATVDGLDVNGSTFRPLLDDDGSEVLFLSSASNLVEGDTDGAFDLFTWGSR